MSILMDIKNELINFFHVLCPVYWSIRRIILSIVSLISHY